MPFHVEIRRSFRRAWAFNLDEGRLRRTVLEPWRTGRPVELGDLEWDPGASTLRILEGPALEPPDLAMGKGWHNAERSAKDVTALALSRAARQAATVAVLAETPSARDAVIELLKQLGVVIVDWSVVRARILASEPVGAGRPLDGVEVVAAVLASDRSDPTRSWAFEAGLALGALGRSAIIAQLGDGPPLPEWGAVDAVRLDPGKPASRHALAERLRGAGYPLESG
jgi:hypothetical protein